MRAYRRRKWKCIIPPLSPSVSYAQCILCTFLGSLPRPLSKGNIHWTFLLGQFYRLSFPFCKPLQTKPPPNIGKIVETRGERERERERGGHFSLLGVQTNCASFRSKIPGQIRRKKKPENVKEGYITRGYRRRSYLT